MDNKTLAKQKIRLLDIIPGSKTKNGNVYFVEPCPICSHKGHFIINADKNLYCSHSGCCKGGSVIDWFIEYELLSPGEAVKKTLSMAGLENDLLDKTQLKKIKEAKKIDEEKNKILDSFRNGKENLVNTIIHIITYYKSKNKQSYKKRIIKQCYHKLTRMEIALRGMNDKDCFLNWLLNFIDGYTTRFVIASDEESMYKLCLDFKEELHYSYINFVSYEQDLIELVGISDELKLLSGGIR